MATFTAYHNITYDSGTSKVFHNGVTAGIDIELIKPGTKVVGIKSIVMANTHATADTTVSLFIQNNPTAAAASTFYILSTVAIPPDATLVLDDPSVLSFNNSSPISYGLYLTLGASDGTNTLDIMINR